MTKIRVGVLMGGKSIEKEVSFNSGRTVCDHLDTSRYDIIPIFQKTDGSLFILPWHFLHRGKIADFEHRLAKEAQPLIWDELKSLVDFMYIAMHGRFAEDGIMQATLELLGIPYLGASILASSLCMDKIRIKTLLKSYGFTTPRDIVINPHQLPSLTPKKLLPLLELQQLEFPLIVKPHNEGSSIGVAAVHSMEELQSAIIRASEVHPNKKQPVLIEEMLHGMEFSCITLVDYTKKELLALPPTEIVHENNTAIFDYEQKYMPGRAFKFTPPRTSDAIITDIQETCKKIMRDLSIETISRIDGFVVQEKVVIVDVNTFSGMAPSSFVFREAAEVGMSHTDLINHLIETDLDRYTIFTHKDRMNAMKKNKEDYKKMRVGVLLGGASHEREISLESGRNIIYKLSPHKYDTTPIFVTTDLKLYQITQSQLVRNSTKEITATLKIENQITWQSLTSFDFIFIGLHGGAGENGCVQGMLEMLGIPYNGSSVLASALAMDKYKTTQYLHAAGFDVPRNVFITRDGWKKNASDIIASIETQIAFPCIIKPSDDGCSVMVYKAKNKKDLIAAIENILKEKAFVLVEEFIVGMELTVGVVGNQIAHALPPSQAISTGEVLSIEEKFLPGAGENQTPAPLPEKTLQLVMQTMEQIYTSVGCKGYARIDCFYQTAQQSPTGTERVVTIEINSLPGLTPATCIFHQAAEIGIKPMDFIDLIVQYGFAEHCGHSEPILETIRSYVTPSYVSKKSLTP